MRMGSRVARHNRMSGRSTVAPRDLLINLCDEIPAFAEAFPRVAELVTSDEDCRMSRVGNRYADVSSTKGHKLNTHKI